MNKPMSNPASSPTRKVWPVSGGVHPPDNKAQSLTRPLADLPLPARLILPVNQHIGAPARPVVTVGQAVLKGELIAEANGQVSAPVHAPTSGVIADIGDYPLPHPSGMSAPCIVITPDGEDRWVERTALEDPFAIEPAELLQRIRAAGITGLGGAGFPAAVKLNPAPDKVIRTLIINGAECEPYITADHCLMETYPDELIAGIRILWHILGHPEEVLIGLEDNKASAVSALLPAIEEGREDCPIELVEFPTVYPSGGEKQLVQILTGQELPTGKLPADIGVVCQNVGTVHAVYRAIVRGEPLISRITTVTGDAVARPGNYRVLLGTPIEHVLEQCGFDADNCPRLIMGGPMMGFTLLDTTMPVIKTTNCLLAPSREEVPPAPVPQPCIRCGLCAEVCPASLLPQQLYWYSQSHQHDMLESHNLFDCIECGACAYICPSSIPLVQYYRASKGEIRQLHLEKQKADRARERFEYHQQRIEQAEAEKAAKREARLKAAQKAKEQQAAKADKSDAAGAAAPADKGVADLISAAQAKAAARKADPEQQRAKLERGVVSATNRVNLAREKLEAAQSQDVAESPTEARSEQGDQTAALQAALADAEHRLQQAQARLAEFDQNAAKAAASMSAQVDAKMNTGRLEQLKQKVATLRKRVGDTEARLSSTEDESIAAALQQGLDKMRGKLAEAERELSEAQSAAPTETPAATAPAEQDAATAAIERAKARAAAQATMSEEEKLADQLASLQKRLQKSREKLAQAEADNSEHVEALRNGLSKLEEKLAQTEQALAECKAKESS